MEKIYIADLEADGLLDTATQVWCGVFKELNTGEVKKFYPDGTDFVASMLSFMDTIDVLIMHGGILYDWPLLKKLHGYDFKGKKVDTLIMSRLQDPKRFIPPHCPNKTAPHSVEVWGYRVGEGKPEHDDWSQFSEAMLHRCTKDVEIQEKIYHYLREEAKGFRWRDATLLTFNLFTNLQRQQEYGWLVDKDHMYSCIKMLTHWIDRIDKAIIPLLPLVIEVEEVKVKGEYRHVSKPFKKDGTYTSHTEKWRERVAGGLPVDVRGPYSRINIRYTDLNSNKEVKEYLLASGWIPKEWNTSRETGERTSPKLSKDDPFEGIQGGIGRLVARRVQCKQRRSIIEGWLGVIRLDGRIPSVITNLAVTGRATHKNIVNVPGGNSFFAAWMRKIFITKPGWKLVGTDSDACQIRMLAGRMNDDDYTNTILNGNAKDGTDMHTINQKAAGLDTRDDAKTFFYGFLFGAGDAKVGRIVGGTAKDGARLKAQFMQGLPALGRLLEALTNEWKKTAKQRYNKKFGRMELYNGIITGLDGRPIKVPSEHMLLVYLLQSDEAIMMAAAYNIFHKWMDDKYTFGVDYGTVCWYHDEWTVECREEIASAVGALAEKAIEWAGNFYNIPCPHKGHAQIGNNWWEIH